MQKICGVFNGTAAAVYLCVGAVPVSVKLINVEVATNSNFLEWHTGMTLSTVCYEGILMTGSTGVYTVKTYGAGICVYEGGDLLTSANQTSVAYGEGVFLGWDLADYRANKSHGCASTAINTWTLDTSGNRTGHVNDDTVSSGNRIGVGSRIRVKENSTGLVKEAGVTAWTAGQGVSADEVTLTRPLASGSVTFIGGMYQLAPIALGKVAPAGILLSETAAVNINDNTVLFEMEIDSASPQ
jgi:hypothetical protein